VSLVVKKSELNRALVIRRRDLGFKKINITIFGHGLVGER
jgi:hypothetical protein